MTRQYGSTWLAVGDNATAPGHVAGVDPQAEAPPRRLCVSTQPVVSEIRSGHVQWALVSRAHKAWILDNSTYVCRMYFAPYARLHSPA